MPLGDFVFSNDFFFPPPICLTLSNLPHPTSSTQQLHSSCPTYLVGSCALHATRFRCTTLASHSCYQVTTTLHTPADRTFLCITIILVLIQVAFSCTPSVIDPVCVWGEWGFGLDLEVPSVPSNPLGLCHIVSPASGLIWVETLGVVLLHFNTSWISQFDLTCRRYKCTWNPVQCHNTHCWTPYIFSKCTVRVYGFLLFMNKQIGVQLFSVLARREGGADRKRGV